MIIWFQYACIQMFVVKKRETPIMYMFSAISIR